MSKTKLSAEPLTCKMCNEKVPPNETFKHLQVAHKIRKPTNVMDYYKNTLVRLLIGAAKRMQRRGDHR